MNKLHGRPSPALVIALCATLAACADATAADADAGTILFTNPGPFDYVVLAHNPFDPTSTDTGFSVPIGTQVCWRFSGPRPMPVTMELYSYEASSGYARAAAEVHPRLESSSWDGAEPNATEVTSC